MNLANLEPFTCFSLSCSIDSGRVDKGGDGLGERGGINAHTEERSSFGWSRFCSSAISRISFAKSKIGAKTAHGMLKFRCGITVPPPCLALLCQEYNSLNKELYLSLNKEVQSPRTGKLN